MSLPYLDGEALARMLPILDAVDALSRAFAESNRPPTPQRTRLEHPHGELLLMPAVDAEGLGVKLVTLSPENPARGLPLIHAVYVLFAAPTGAPTAVIDGAALTALRTSAVSALATRHLARAEASRLVVFGAGVQATAHVDAMRAVRPIASLRVVSRSPEPAQRLAARAANAGLDAAVAGPEVVAEADIVCTCTTSPTPVFDGKLLSSGTHVNAVGAYRPDQRELDDAVVGGARVFVETRDAALTEAGDLIQAVDSGALDPSGIGELGAVVRGEQGRKDAEEITVFKSVGVAFEDLVVATAALERA